jgi:peptidylprolyl isomerase
MSHGTGMMLAIMKPIVPVLLFTLAAPAFSQSTTSTTPRPVVHRATAAAAAAKSTDPVLADSIPKVPGTPKVLYSLKYLDILVGAGPDAVPRKWFTVHYTGYLTDGTKFDSSVDRGEPITFPYGAHQVIPGWDTGFEGMKVGGKRRLFVPYQLAYGDSGRSPTIPPKAMLIFDVELLGISDNPPPKPEAPKPAEGQPGQPAAPPAGAGSDTSKPPATPPAKPMADPTKPTATTPPASSAAPTGTTPPVAPKG